MNYSIRRARIGKKGKVRVARACFLAFVLMIARRNENMI